MDFVDSIVHRLQYKVGDFLDHLDSSLGREDHYQKSSKLKHPSKVSHPLGQYPRAPNVSNARHGSAVPSRKPFLHEVNEYGAFHFAYEKRFSRRNERGINEFYSYYGKRLSYPKNQLSTIPPISHIPDITRPQRRFETVILRSGDLERISDVGYIVGRIPAPRPSTAYTQHQYPVHPTPKNHAYASRQDVPRNRNPYAFPSPRNNVLHASMKANNDRIDANRSLRLDKGPSNTTMRRSPSSRKGMHYERPRSHSRSRSSQHYRPQSSHYIEENDRRMIFSSTGATVGEDTIPKYSIRQPRQTVVFDRKAEFIDVHGGTEYRYRDKFGRYSLRKKSEKQRGSGDKRDCPRRHYGDYKESPTQDDLKKGCCPCTDRYGEERGRR